MIVMVMTRQGENVKDVLTRTVGGKDEMNKGELKGDGMGC